MVSRPSNANLDARLLAGVFACGLLLGFVGLVTPGNAQELKAPPGQGPLPPRREGVPPPAKGYQIQREVGFTLEFVPSDEATASRVRGMFARARQATEDAFGRSLPAEPHVIVAPTDSEFARRYARVAGSRPPSTVLAVALPGRDLVIVRSSGVVEGTSAGLESTLRHELGHLVLGEVEKLRGQSLPRWLNEGLCEVAGGRTLTGTEANSLSNWSTYDKIPPLEDYASSFPRHGTSGPRAYLISFGFVSWLGERKPIPTLIDALERKPVNDAFLEVHGELPSELHLDWTGELMKDQSNWKTLFYSLNVWSVAALLAIVAGLRAYAQRRKLSKELAEEEARRAPRLEAAWARVVEKLAAGQVHVLCPECQRGNVGGEPPRCSNCALGPPAPTTQETS